MEKSAWDLSPPRRAFSPPRSVTHRRVARIALQERASEVSQPFLQKKKSVKKKKERHRNEENRSPFDEIKSPEISREELRELASSVLGRQLDAADITGLVAACGIEEDAASVPMVALKALWNDYNDEVDERSTGDSANYTREHEGPQRNLEGTVDASGRIRMPLHRESRMYKRNTSSPALPDDGLFHSIESLEEMNLLATSAERFPSSSSSSSSSSLSSSVSATFESAVSALTSSSISSASASLSTSSATSSAALSSSSSSSSSSLQKKKLMNAPTTRFEEDDQFELRSELLRITGLHGKACAELLEVKQKARREAAMAREAARAAEAAHAARLAKVEAGARTNRIDDSAMSYAALEEEQRLRIEAKVRADLEQEFFARQAAWEVEKAAAVNVAIAKQQHSNDQGQKCEEDHFLPKRPARRAMTSESEIGGEAANERLRRERQELEEREREALALGAAREWAAAGAAAAAAAAAEAAAEKAAEKAAEAARASERQKLVEAEAAWLLERKRLEIALQDEIERRQTAEAEAKVARANISPTGRNSMQQTSLSSSLAANEPKDIAERDLHGWDSGVCQNHIMEGLQNRAAVRQPRRDNQDDRKASLDFISETIGCSRGGAFKEYILTDSDNLDEHAPHFDQHRGESSSRPSPSIGDTTDQSATVDTRESAACLSHSNVLRRLLVQIGESQEEPHKEIAAAKKGEGTDEQGDGQALRAEPSHGGIRTEMTSSAVALQKVVLSRGTSVTGANRTTPTLPNPSASSMSEEAATEPECRPKGKSEKAITPSFLVQRAFSSSILGVAVFMMARTSIRFLQGYAWPVLPGSILSSCRRASAVGRRFFGSILTPRIPPYSTAGT